MTEKRFTVFKSKLTGLFVVNDNIHEFHFEGVENASTIMKLVGLLNNYIEENEELKKENKELKFILQDMGLIRSDEEVKNIRDEIASKVIKPLCKGNRFDADVNTENGFLIIPKDVKE